MTTATLPTLAAVAVERLHTRLAELETNSQLADAFHCVQDLVVHDQLESELRDVALLVRAREILSRGSSTYVDSLLDDARLVVANMGRRCHAAHAVDCGV